MENFTTCPKLKTPIMDCKFTHASIHQNILRLIGNVNVKRNLSQNLSLVWRYKKCPMGLQACSNQMDYPIPGVCMIISKKTIFGDEVGRNFVPKFKCPIKSGKYSFNFSISLKGITLIPSPKNKYHIKLEMLNGPKQESVVCIELVSWIKSE